MIEFKLDLKSGVPFHRQIVDQIRYGIASGRLLPGEHLRAGQGTPHPGLSR